MFTIKSRIADIGENIFHSFYLRLKSLAVFLCFAITVFLFIGAFPVCGYELQYTNNFKKIRLRWRSDVINLTLSNSLNQAAANFKPNSDVAGAVQRSLSTWESATNLKFAVVWSDKSSISKSDGNGDGFNLITIAATPENVALFRGDFNENPGRTRTFYDKRGNIVEADIVLNPYQQFSTDGSVGTFDFEAALTHEIGHLLGLDHSAALAATMYSQQGRNGTFSLPAYAPRTLAEDDLAGIRFLYGAKTENENCCGAVEGILTSNNGKSLANWQIWAEETATGKLFAVVTSNDKGFWSIGGLPSGKYRVITQNLKFSAEVLSQHVSLENDKTTTLNREILPRQHSVNSLLIGYNGQLMALAVPLNREHWQTIFFGREKITPESLKIKSFLVTSPSLQIASGSTIEQSFDAFLPIASFNLFLEPNLIVGEYNLQVNYVNGDSEYVLGCFSVDEN